MLSESSPHTVITSFAAADTDGSYVQLIASTTRAYKWMIVAIVTGTQSITGLVDLAVGSAGNEVEFMSDHLLHTQSGPFPRKSSTLFYFPVDIAAASEVRARIQDTSTSAIGWLIKVMFSDVGPPAGTPTQADFSGKVSVSSDTAQDAYGSYVNLITSAAHAGKWLLIGVGSGNGVSGNNELEFSIGVGNPPTGTDAIDEFGSVHIKDGGGGIAYTGKSMLVPCDFALGDQLQIRVKDNHTSIAGYAFSVQLLG